MCEAVHTNITEGTQSTTEVRFGKDYYNYFDTKTYLNSYFTGISEETPSHSQFAMRNFHEAWSKMPEGNLRVLEFGGGPNISALISAEPYTKEIIFAEYSERNRREVEGWLQKSPDSHDWSSYFNFVVQNLEGKASEEVSIRQEALRKKVTHILSCDIGWEDPVKWPSSWSTQIRSFDVITTNLCLEASVTSTEDYRHAIAKLSRYLKAGGYFVMHGVLGESFYMVGNEKFYCFPLSKSIIEETFAEEGYQILDLKVFALDPTVTKGNCNAEGLFFFRGRFDAHA